MKILKNFGWLGGEQILKVVTGFVVAIGLARSLGPESWGLLNWAIAVVAFPQSLIALGLHGILKREFLQKKDRPSLIATVFAGRLVVGIFLWMAFVVWAFIAIDSRESLAIVLIISLTCFQHVGLVFEGVFHAEGRMFFPSCIRITATIFFAIIVLLGLIYDQGVLFFAWAYLIEFALYQFFLIWGGRRAYSLQLSQFSIVRFFTLVKESKWVLLNALVMTIILQMDTYLIGLMGDSEELGIYHAGIRIDRFASAFPPLVFSVFFPFLLNEYSENRFVSDGFNQLYLDLLAMGGWVLIFVATFCSEPLIQILYGDLYQHSARIWQGHAWFSLIYFLMLGRSAMVVFQKRYKQILCANSFGMILGALVGLYFYQFYGLNAVVAMMIVTAVLSLLIWIFMNGLKSTYSSSILLALIVPFRGLSFVRNFYFHLIKK